MNGRRQVAMLAGLLLTASVPAAAGMKTFVSRVGQDDTRPRLGVPVVRVLVDAPTPQEAGAYRASLEADLAKLTHAVVAPEGAPEDYALRLKIGRMDSQGANSRLPFEALLVERNGETVWHATGVTEIDAGGTTAPLPQSIGRNILDALSRDRWIQLKPDPNNPAPSPPRL